MQNYRSVSASSLCLAAILLSGCNEEPKTASQAVKADTSPKAQAEQQASTAAHEQAQQNTETAAQTSADKAATAILKEKAAQALKKAEQSAAKVATSAAAKTSLLGAEVADKADALKDTATQKALEVSAGAESLLQ